jgi:NO-binding membrane sensor protein with MHYT domain
MRLRKTLVTVGLVGKFLLSLLLGIAALAISVWAVSFVASHLADKRNHDASIDFFAGGLALAVACALGWAATVLFQRSARERRHRPEV